MDFRDIFYLNRSDRRIILVLLTAGLLLLVALLWLGGESTDPLTSPADTIAVDTSSVKQQFTSSSSAPYDQGQPSPALFPFDPNTADSTALLRLGLRPWQVRSIYKYRAAGGIYRRKEDFARLYGLTQKQYRELEPYIRISSDYAPAADLFPQSRQRTYYEEQPRTNRYPSAAADTMRRYSPKLKAGEHLDLNLSDTSAFQRVPGIGSYFARQIVRYRERLGGFYSTDQLREIPDFPEKAMPYLVLTNQSRNNLRRISVNKSSLNELKRHPYINYYQARAITDYRRTRGPLTTLQQLRLLPVFTEQQLERLSPYVDYSTK